MSRLADRSVVTPVTGWSVAAAPSGTVPTPAGLDGLAWLPARVPGTVAGALRDAGRWASGDRRDLDGEDWWFRARLGGAGAAEGEEVVLRLGGLATLAEVFLDGALVLSSQSMFARHEIALGAGALEGSEVAIRCRALGPLLATPRRPRARWRTRIAPGELRHHRTMLLGRAPGFAPGPPAIGPWRGVDVVRRRDVAVDGLRLRARVDRGDGCLTITARLRGIGGVAITSAAAEVAGPSGTHSTPLVLTAGCGAVVATGEVRIPDVARWWPHTHGAPTLHLARLLLTTSAGPVRVDAGRVGFRELCPGPPGHDVLADGLDLRVNGVRVFARGAVWTPIDLVGMAPAAELLRAALLRVRDAGMNMLRLVGTAAYESSAFHDLCDELGLLVWQDFMFANFDYPLADGAFRALVEEEASDVLADLGWRPSLTVLCGNSEVEQQAAMFGRGPAEGRGELFGELLPRLVDEADLDAPYVPSAPCGGDLPFRPDRGIAGYYGVGGYRRPLSDARAAGVRFAAECLALANLPDDDRLADVGVPRDVGSPWDFAEVRDHYLGVLYGVDAAILRHDDPARYLRLARSTSGELMAEVFGEWRRAGSPCGGGLVLWLTDVEPGAGWGVLDHRGAPKAAYHHLRRALAPIAVWMTDEGLSGLDVHVANDGAEPLRADLRVAFYRSGEILVEEARTTIDLAAHDIERCGAEDLLGRFVDASYAYRFGPPGFDVVVASLERARNGTTDLLAQAVRFPAGRPATGETADRLGLAACAHRDGDDLVATVRSRRFAHGVRLHVPGFDPDDDAFSVEPGGCRTVRLHPEAEGHAMLPVRSAAQLSAVNLTGRIDLELEPV